MEKKEYLYHSLQKHSSQNDKKNETRIQQNPDQSFQVLDDVGGNEMKQIIIYYNKKQVHSGKPITVRVGKSSIQCDKLFLNNLSGEVIFQTGLKATGYNKRYGISCPLVIPILEEPPSKRALKERQRYRSKK